MDPWAIMNTQEIWAQPSPPANSTIVTEVTMVTARSNTQLSPSPSPPLLLASPALPLMDGPYAWHLANLRQPKTAITRRETSRNEGKGDGKCHLGVSDKTRQTDRGTLCATVEKQGEWLTNHLLNPGKSPPTPISTNALKTTRLAFPGGSHHPLTSSGPTGPYVGPKTLLACSDLTKTTANWSREVEIDEGRRLQGVLVELKRPGQQKPQIAAEKGGKWLENHSPTDKTPQAAPPPSQVPETTQFASSGGNHPLTITSTCSTCFDVYSHVKNHPVPPQMPSDSNQTVK